jgi:phosphinothricin acetyltransferase
MEPSNAMTAPIRLALPGDAEQIATIYAPFCTDIAVSFEYVAPSASEMAGRICKITERLPWLVLDDDGTIAGYVYASPHRERAAYQWSVDVAAYVASDYRRRGVGSALYTALFRVLAAQGYFKAYAGVTLPNPASERLHESMGFERVGEYVGVGYKFGKWHDVRWYQKSIQPEKQEPAPPRMLRDALGTEDWKQSLVDGLHLSQIDNPGLAKLLRDSAGNS